MLISTQQLIIPVSSGTGQQNTVSLRGMVRQIAVKPVDENTSFGIMVTNALGIVVFE